MRKLIYSLLWVVCGMSAAPAGTACVPGDGVQRGKLV